jgi:hypothetical protein
MMEAKGEIPTSAKGKARQRIAASIDGKGTHPAPQHRAGRYRKDMSRRRPDRQSRYGDSVAKVQSP